MSAGEETLRWPTNLDHGSILVRLARFREEALARGLADLSSRFAAVESMPAAKIALLVVASIAFLEDLPEHRPLATQLEMVAMNLKNLK